MPRKPLKSVTNSSLSIQIYNEAQKLIKQIIKNHHFHARATIGLWHANSIDDDIEIYADEKRRKTLVTLHFFRQQKIKNPKTLP